MERLILRTTLTIPDDVLLAARQRAEARGITIGEAIGISRGEVLRPKRRALRATFGRMSSCFRTVRMTHPSPWNWLTDSGMNWNKWKGLEAPTMRTTVKLDDDAVAIAKETAEETGITLGQAISLLIRQAASANRSPVEYPGRFKPFPERPGEPLITLELVNRLRDELP
jgi:antitoxin component of RelBE/YafQ-DinJ toxin-antitoxin module